MTVQLWFKNDGDVNLARGHCSQPRLCSTIGLKYLMVLKSDGIALGVVSTNAMNQSGFQG
ncbi:MAG: hypothetical protein F4103_19365 [Boseongicola sp. SB0673_bin_14]|nr:hypothetical protein [Boseongicola sp. SB0667_bin_21]MYI70794.1 hypothetical protein [Boseongicola sp. SB0673_bin_14]